MDDLPDRLDRVAPVHGIEQFFVRGADAAAEALEHFKRERGVAADFEEESSGLKDHESGLPDGFGGGASGQRFEERHLADEIAFVEVGERQFAGCGFLGDPNLALLDDVHFSALVAFGKDGFAIGEFEDEFLGEALVVDFEHDSILVGGLRLARVGEICGASAGLVGISGGFGLVAVLWGVAG